ncbi:MAG TPA: MFS transporter, partial [Microbacterium sp.]|nr:MFS transporter [Microbacterium sp.]
MADQDDSPENVPVGPPDGATAASVDDRAAARESGTDDAGTTGHGDHDTRFFGQPWALAHIFGVEMWERFSFYGMQGILLIYMYFSVAEGGLGIDR